MPAATHDARRRRYTLTEPELDMTLAALLFLLDFLADGTTTPLTLAGGWTPQMRAEITGLLIRLAAAKDQPDEPPTPSDTGTGLTVAAIFQVSTKKSVCVRRVESGRDIWLQRDLFVIESDTDTPPARGEIVFITAQEGLLIEKDLIK